MRTGRAFIAIDHPFTLAGADGVQPAGTCAVDVDEDPIEGLSVPAYQRIATAILLPLGTGGSVIATAIPLPLGTSGSGQAVRVDPGGLSAGRRETAPPAP